MYRLYLNGVRFPIAPEKISTKISNKNKTIDLLNGGEMNIIKEAGLTEFSFDLLLPVTKYPFATYPDGFHRADYYTDILEKLKTEKTTFQFILNRSTPRNKALYNTNVKVTLEYYTIKEDVDYGFDVMVNIKLKKYVAYATKKVTVTPKKNKRTTTTRDTSSKPSSSGSYTIVSGDTLSGISLKKYGTASKWTSIYNANVSVIESTAKSHGRASSSNGHWIYPNCVITIP